ncbi:MAG: DUF2867 domain-containing protein [Anaerolineales bacterium]|nr:DUF2867 domain-containing protein [Anaerolineales bacterium]
MIPSDDESVMEEKTPRILVTGVTGYIGGRLAPRLLEAGYRVRVLVRDRDRLAGRPWIGKVDVAAGDARERAPLTEAMRGVDAAFFLLHSQRGGTAFLERNLAVAERFAEAARAAQIRQIIFLGGLGDETGDRSGLLASQRRTAGALRRSGVPLTEFRSGPVVGSGSVLFEIVRYITERSPVILCPKWLFTPIQPIAIRDLLGYLLLAVCTPTARGKVIEIGGPEVTTLLQMMRAYAQERGERRWMIPLPAHLPWISAQWVHWMTPIPDELARTRIESLRRPAVVNTHTAEGVFGRLPLMHYRESLRRAIQRMEQGKVETAWSDALASSQGDLPPGHLESQEGLILEHRQRLAAAAPEEVFHVFTSLGGEQGWFYMDWLWRLRAWLDRLAGGVGRIRGRRHPHQVRPGDVIDFWRVEKVDQGRMLRLRAEMRMFGLGWLEFLALPFENGKTRLLLTAYYLPKGFLGILYWHFLKPIHSAIFSGLIRAICRRAESLSKIAA